MAAETLLEPAFGVVASRQVIGTLTLTNASVGICATTSS
jgi:hypothetical protein